MELISCAEPRKMTNFLCLLSSPDLNGLAAEFWPEAVGHGADRPDAFAGYPRRDRCGAVRFDREREQLEEAVPNIGDRVHEVTTPARPAGREPTRIAGALLWTRSGRPGALPA
jgi:hypothetical protein